MPGINTILLIVILIVLVYVAIALQVQMRRNKNDHELLSGSSADLRGLLSENREKSSRDVAELKTDMTRMLGDQQMETATLLGEHQAQVVKELGENSQKLTRSMMDFQNKSQAELSAGMMQGFKLLQDTTGVRLGEIQESINVKLDKSLNERLDNSFRQVGERLESLYKSLGELRSLESGVNSLNRTLSNVKSRGIFGELQLGNILANILDRSQYEENVVTIPGSSERVEFAIRIPDKDSGSVILLPIDSKFPADIYNRILTASESGDTEGLKSAQKELRDRIRQEAKTIEEKYVAAPYTTDFAVMFLPTEGLYAEVLRLDGLVEKCQNDHKIIISGPSTLTALINSLSIGFRYLTVNKKSEEILDILGDFRTQFTKFDDLIAQTGKKLQAAQEKTEELSKRSSLIQKKLNKVESLGYEDHNILWNPEGSEYDA